MYDFALLEKTRAGSEFDNMYLLSQQREELRKTKPYYGLTILQNVPLTISTIFKIEALALGGAEVTSYASSVIPADPKAVSLLRQANFTVTDVLKFSDRFDFHLDCCAELVNIKKPRIGAVELTQSGSMIYQQANLDYPIISVDDSKIKVLETFLGTGDGLTRALDTKIGMIKSGKPFVVFGNGKVGKGIIYALQKFTNDITVVALEESFTNKKPGIKYISATNTDAIKAAIANCFAVITATGKQHLMSKIYNFKKTDFGDAILINMGAEDEYGPNFNDNDVEFLKKPFNFSLEMPTALRYLDPIFYAHNISIDLILANQAFNGYNPFPNDLANKIINNWRTIYQEPVEEALLSF